MIFNSSREKDSRVATYAPSLTSTHGNGSSLGTIIYHNGVSRLSGTLESISEFVHPNFDKRMLGHSVIMGDMLKYWGKHDISDDYVYLGPYSNWNEGGHQVMRGDIMQFIERQVPGADFTVLQANIARAEALAVTKAHSKFNVLSVLTPEYVKEYRQTLDMFKNPLSSATTLLERTRKLRKKNLGRLPPTAVNVARATSDAWLQNRYGWTPIIGDFRQCSGAWDDFTTRQDEKEAFLVVRASQGFESTVGAPFDVPIVTGSALRLRGDTSYFTGIKANAGVFYRIKRLHLSDELMLSLGIHGTQTASNLWELTQFSFIADWFVNFGDWLQAIRPDPRVEIRGAWVTTVLREQYSYKNCSYRCDQLGTVNSGALGGSTISRVTITRNTRPSVPLTPTFKCQNLSIKQQADSFALSIGKVNQLMQSLRH